MELNWSMVGATATLLSLHGCIFVAIAKSIFITKNELKDLQDETNLKLYKDGLPIYLPAKDCDKMNVERDRRRDAYSRVTCKKIEELKKEIKNLREIVLIRKLNNATQ